MACVLDSPRLAGSILVLLSLSDVVLGAIFGSLLLALCCRSWRICELLMPVPNAIQAINCRSPAGRVKEMMIGLWC